MAYTRCKSTIGCSDLVHPVLTTTLAPFLDRACHVTLATIRLAEVRVFRSYRLTLSIHHCREGKCKNDGNLHPIYNLCYRLALNCSKYDIVQ